MNAKEARELALKSAKMDEAFKKIEKAAREGSLSLRCNFESGVIENLKELGYIIYIPNADKGYNYEINW